MWFKTMTPRKLRYDKGFRQIMIDRQSFKIKIRNYHVNPVHEKAANNAVIFFSQLYLCNAQILSAISTAI